MKPFTSMFLQSWYGFPLLLLPPFGSWGVSCVWEWFWISYKENLNRIDNVLLLLGTRSRCSCKAQLCKDCCQCQWHKWPRPLVHEFLLWRSGLWISSCGLSGVAGYRPGQGQRKKCGSGVLHRIRYLGSTSWVYKFALVRKCFFSKIISRCSNISVYLCKNGFNWSLTTILSGRRKKISFNV